MFTRGLDLSVLHSLFRCSNQLIDDQFWILVSFYSSFSWKRKIVIIRNMLVIYFVKKYRCKISKYKIYFYFKLKEKFNLKLDTLAAEGFVNVDTCLMWDAIFIWFHVQTRPKSYS